MTFNAQLAAIKDAREDFEWYPTTREILSRLAGSIRRHGADHYNKKTFLDIGAGNGKVFDYLKEKEFSLRFHAIEKSHCHIKNLPPDVSIMGVDFWQNSLVNQFVDFIFSNPPYSEYEEWALKILREVPCTSVVYLVLPVRWKDCTRIQALLMERKADTVRTLGTYDFTAAEDRTARAQVDLIEITFPKSYHGGTDPFETFFTENFSYPDPPEVETQTDTERIEELAMKESYVDVLLTMYQERMDTLRENYASLCRIDYQLLQELDISKELLMNGLRGKIADTKKFFWSRLFAHMAEIRCRLTNRSREQMESKMNNSTGIEFNAPNIYAVMIWAVNNANSYFDQQLIDTYERLINYANVENYRSNQRVFTEHGFRYEYQGRTSDDPATHFRLKVGHRLVLEGWIGLERSQWSERINLSESALKYVQDLLTIADNLGFSTRHVPIINDQEWKDSKARVFTFLREGKEETLFEVRVFLKGNMHVRFNPEFVHALNIAFGKLKGWINSPAEAARETDAPAELATQYFEHSAKITEKTLKLLPPAA